VRCKGVADWPNQQGDGERSLAVTQFRRGAVPAGRPTAGRRRLDRHDRPLRPRPILHVHETEFRYAGETEPSAPGGMAAVYSEMVTDQARANRSSPTSSPRPPLVATAWS
jgi:hypothetical protein